MADTISVSCPDCGKQINAPAELAGKKIKCKECGAVFPVKAPAAAKAKKAAAKEAKPAKEKQAAAKAKKSDLDDEDDGPASYGVTHEELAPRCPHCAKEMESEEAIVCLHCGYNTRTRTQGATKRVVHRTFLDWLLWLGPGLLALAAVGALFGFDYWFWYGLADMWKSMDESLGAVSFSMGIRVWVLFFSFGAKFFIGRFAFKRLILHPVPPEVEAD